MKKADRKILTMQVGADLLQALEGESARTGLTVSSLVRMRLLSSYGMEPVKVPEAMHVIRVAALDGFVPAKHKRVREKA